MSTLAVAASARAAVLELLRPAVLQGMRDYADSSATPSRLQIYGTTRPATSGDDPGGSPLVTLILTRPCGEVDAGVLSLTQESTIGDLIGASGDAVWGRWENGDGDPVADGDVTDMAGAGPFKLDGADGTNLYAGGRAILGEVALT